MPRPPKCHWSDRERAWRSDVGPRGTNGRRTAVYFRQVGPRDVPGAARALVAYLAERDAREDAEAESLTNPRLVDLANTYLRHARSLSGEDARAPRTLATHRERLRRFLKLKDPAGVLLGNRLAASLTDTDGARALAKLKADGCGPRRIDGILRSVNAVLNWAASPEPGREPRRIIPANPFAGLKGPRLPRGAKRLITRAEMAAFLRSAWRQVNVFKLVEGRRCSGCHRSGKRHKGPCRRSHNPTALYDRATLLMVRCQFYAGTRPGELCAATWEDWQPRGWTDPATGLAWGVLSVRGKMTSRTGHLRTILVPPALARGIEQQRTGPTAHPDRIFPRRAARGVGMWNSVDLSAKVRRWRIAAGLGPHFVLYRMRTTFYTEAVEAGLTADQAGAVGGTSAKVVEASYFQRRVAALGQAAARVDRSRRGRG